MEVSMKKGQRLISVERMILITLASLIPLLTIPSPTAWADGPPAPKLGWSARFEAGVGYISSTDNLRASGENQEIEDLDGEGDRHDDFIPLVLFLVKYTFNEAGTAFYFGIPRVYEGPPALSLGLQHPLGKLARLDASLILRPFSDVWEDPYLVNTDREETGRSVYGADLDFEDIFGTHLGLAYTYLREDVKDDLIGERIKELQRDGNSHQFEVDYDLFLGRGMVLEPKFSYSRGLFDGNANSYQGFGAGISLLRFTGTHGIYLQAAFENRDYDEVHPVFGKTREDRVFAFFGRYELSGLFGHEKLFGGLIAGYLHRESNIDFFDSGTFIGGLTLGYRL
jgi:hypothetical protein